MAEFLTEEEQIIALKEWWKKYGMYIVIGVLAGVAFYFTWSIWQSRNDNIRAEAGFQYQQVANAILDADTKTAHELIDSEKYVQLPMPYAYLEKLLEAQMYVEQKKGSEAESSLQQALVVSNDAFFHQLASVRLARLLLAQGKAQEALELMRAQPEQAVLTNPEIALVKADAYVALNDNANAQEQYKIAWDALPSFSPQRQVVAMLLADLPKE